MPTNIRTRLASLGETLFPGMDVRQAATLYLLVPLGIGAVLGWYRAGYAADYPLAVSLLDWLMNFVTLWIAFDVGSRLIAFLLRPWTPRLWIILVIGGVAGVAVSRPIRSVIRDITSSLAPNVPSEIAFPPNLVWEQYVFAYAGVIAVPILIWVVVNYIYVEALGVPRFGHLSKKSEAEQSGQTFVGREEDQVSAAGPSLHDLEFVKKLSGGPHTGIRALQAEDHYLRVHTDRNNELIRYRFSDALNEVQHLPGLQVHRSFWISTTAINYIRRSGRSYEIVLKGGLEVPVSRSYRYAVKEAGLLQKFPDKKPEADGDMTEVATR